MPRGWLKKLTALVRNTRPAARAGVCLIIINAAVRAQSPGCHFVTVIGPNRIAGTGRGSGLSASRMWLCTSKEQERAKERGTSGERACGEQEVPRDEWAALRLAALMHLYIHPLYVLVSKILSSILNSSALIHPLYHPLSTLSTVGLTCHFI
jgi:hypothetical protein